MKLARAIDFPQGYGITLGGASRDQQEVFREMFIALLMGIALMYLVLVMQFGSFTAPVPVMLSLPLSLIGVVIALKLTNGSLNLMSFIGIIMLMGLVAKNAILLLDCARKEEAQGVDREDALMHAGRVRLRPILMTTLCTLFGLMPLALGLGAGSEMQLPLALAVIGGLALSTPITLYLVPTFLVVHAFDWINTYQGIVGPLLIDAFGIFLMRQSIISIPADYIEEAPCPASEEDRREARRRLCRLEETAAVEHGLEELWTRHQPRLAA